MGLLTGNDVDDRIKWLDKKEEKSGTMDTYMDTKAL